PSARANAPSRNDCRDEQMPRVALLRKFMTGLLMLGLLVLTCNSAHAGTGFSCTLNATQKQHLVNLLGETTQGYGCNTIGGYGKDNVPCLVTSTADSGVGSLRSCLEAVGHSVVSCKTGLKGPIVLLHAIQVQSFKTLNGHYCP